MARLVACQFVSQPDVEANLRQTETFLQQLDVSDDTLVVLPECFAHFGGGDKALLEVAEKPNDGPVQQKLSDLAKEYGVWLVGGTFPLLADEPGKYTASCLLFDGNGQQRAHYRKIHLFDVQVEDNTGSYLESRYTQPGHEVVVLDSPFGRLGLAVCYDIRFPGQFQAMGQVDVLALPAAFTRRTGQAHWQALVQARAIEMQCYVVAADQGGVHANGRETYGHSCIVSPWGETLAMLEEGPGVIQSSLDQSLLGKIRKSMPVQQHNKFRSQLV